MSIFCFKKSGKMKSIICFITLLIGKNIYCSDEIYEKEYDFDIRRQEKDVLGIEMETFALFSNAKKLGKKATALLTVSDNLITHEETTSEERQNSFNQMIELALESIK